MPIYEFYCKACHTVFQFLAKRPRGDADPACPKCGGRPLSRRPSRFAFVGRAAEPKANQPLSDMDDARLEAAMATLEGEMSGIDENDPRQMARFMRRFSEATGMKIPGMDEAVRRLEAGEDPEKVEEEMGDLLGGDEEPPEGGPGPETGGSATGARLRGLKRRLLPPAQDQRLYPLE
jgi:putative FmdB family regulatory protein